MKNFNSSMADDYQTSQSNLVGAQQEQLGGQRGQPSRSSSRQQMVDEMSQDLNYLSRDAPLDGGESTFGVYSQLGQQRDGSVMHMGSELQEDDEQAARRLLESPQPEGYALDEHQLAQLAPDNVDIQRPLQQAGFLVSFMVDARGGAMRGCRHSGVRVIIPPHSAQMPMRITCRYLRQERLVHPPPLMEGEACASKIMEVGPAGAKFLGPVLLEVPHFASLRGREREIIILRSDKGEVWREHLSDTDDKLVEAIIKSVDEEQQQQPVSGQEPDKRRLTRIVTSDFPHYFAIISRIRQDVHPVGPEGSLVSSTSVPRAQAIFTEGALTKRIKIGLQAREPDPESQLEELRAGTPLSGEHSRPNSAAGKRRSKLLACFRAQKASTDLLNTTDESSAGGESPRRSKRNATGELDSEGEFRSSPSPDSLSGLEPAQVVPTNYYIEPEPPLLLNMEPKTYGKRLASSAAQTEQAGKSLSSSVHSKPKRGFLSGRRRDKMQLTINCNPATRTAAGELPADSSLESAPNSNDELPDVFTSEDQKMRTCTIQTDTDSLQVNYVSLSEETAGTQTGAEGSSGERADDGYVSGSGELKQQKSSRGFFGSKKAPKKATQKAVKKEKRLKADRLSDETSSSDSEHSGAQQVSGRADPPKQLQNEQKEARERKAKEEKRQKKEAAEARRKQAKEAKKQKKEAARKPPEEAAESAKSAASTAQVSFANQLVEERAPEAADDSGKLVSGEEAAEQWKAADETSDKQLASSEEAPLRPILKQQQSGECAEMEQPSKISSVAEELVSEATEEAVRMADTLKSSEAHSPASLSKKQLARAAKEEKERLRREAKERAQADKRRLKEEKAKAKKRPDEQQEEEVSVASKSAKSKKAKKSKSDVSEASESAGEQPSASSAKSLSLLERIFKRRAAPKGSAPLEQPAEPAKRPSEPKFESSALILSEMYPSNPDDADGEMILEVNVPENLIEEKRQLESVVQQTVEALRATETSELPASPTPDESSVLLSEEEAKSSKGVASEQDQEATLVNISQLVTSELNEFDEDATENAVSQVNEFALESPSIASAKKPDEQQVVVGEPARASASELNLKEEKTKRELEAKLEKEAKKRAKEEEKARKKEEKAERARQQKEQKLAAAEAKKAAKEAKKRAKREAEETKRLLQKAGKKGLEEEGALTGEAAAESAGAQEAPQIVDTSEMQPVKSETDVERIVEEVVGPDGVITKTTKTIETKYVTLRQEEFRASERTDLPLDELRRAHSDSSFSSGSSIDSQGERREKRPPAAEPFAGDAVAERERPPAGEPHKELEEILSTPSYFGPERPAELAGKEMAPKKELKKRAKLNKRLVKRAANLAKSEAKVAKRKAEEAQAEIAVCDEALKEAQSELKRALKESKRALKLAKKEHKKMDEVDKKLAKRQKKIEKNQEKLDKKADELSRKAEKRRQKQMKEEAKREAKEAKLARSGSQKSAASRRSIKLEDIGEPVLRSSSRHSLGQRQPEGAPEGGGQPEPEQQPQQVEPAAEDTNPTVMERASPASDDMQVEMSLEDGHLAGGSLEPVGRAAPAGQPEEASNSDDEEADLVSELPDIKSKLQQ